MLCQWLVNILTFPVDKSRADSPGPASAHRWGTGALPGHTAHSANVGAGFVLFVPPMSFRGSDCSVPLKTGSCANFLKSLCLFIPGLELAHSYTDSFLNVMEMGSIINHLG